MVATRALAQLGSQFARLMRLRRRVHLRYALLSSRMRRWQQLRDDDDDEGAQRRLIVTAADLDARCIGLAKSSAALSGVCTGEVVRASLINDEPAAVANGATPPPSQPLHTTDERLSEDEAFVAKSRRHPQSPTYRAAS